MNYIEIFKSGGIHIKKKNRGKFTASAKAAGEGVQEHARNVMNDPNATTLQKRRANFAIQAKKWHHKHQFGGSLKFYQSVDANGTEQTGVDDYETPEPIQIREYKGAPFDISSIYVPSIWERAKDFSRPAPAAQKALTTNTPSYSPWGTFKGVSYKGRTSDELNTLVQMFADAGIGIKVTSGYRANAKTKQGHVSHHSTGNAIDIVPADGNFDRLTIKLKRHPEIINYMRQHGLGILRETSTDVMQGTGATGKHWHIGPDKAALKDLDRLIESWRV